MNENKQTLPISYRIMMFICYLIGSLLIGVGFITFLFGGFILIIIGAVCIALGKFVKKSGLEVKDKNTEKEQ